MNHTYGFPALLSVFVPGLGQVVKGEVGRGVMFFLGVLITLPTIIGGFLMWVWCVTDAYNHQIA